MDAEHRHELKSNELVDFIGNLPEFARKYSNQIIGVILILVALIVIPLYSRMRKQTSFAEESAMMSKIQMARESLAAAAQDTEGGPAVASLATAIEDLEDAAQTTDHADLAALALLEGSELLRAELHIRPDVTADMISANLSRARTACEEAYKKAESPTLRGLAELGLGLCAEEAGDYAEARRIYEKIEATAEYEATAVIEQAQRRMASLDDNASKVVFVEGEEEPSAEEAVETITQEAAAEESTLPSMRADESIAAPPTETGAAESDTP